MRIPYPPIVIGTVVAVALAAGGAGQASAAAPAVEKATVQVIDSGAALAVRKPIKPVEPVVTPIVVDKGGWTNDPYLT
jgi:hypothetical protein